MPRRVVLLPSLFGLALTARLLVLAFRSGDLETWEYETLASNLAQGHGYVITRFGRDVLAFGDGNLYSFVAGALYASLGHNTLILAILQAVLASLAAPVLFAVAERPFGTARATLGAALAALHPGLMAYSLKLHPLGLDAFLLALFVYWSLQPQRRARGVLMTGLALGLNLMSRPTYFLASVGVLAVRVLKSRAELRYIASGIMVAVLIAMPWVARNWVVLGHPLFMSTSFEDVWKGNNIAATGSSWIAPGRTVFDVAPADLRARIWQADELQLNDLFEQATLSFIEQQPDQFAMLVARKFVYFWWLPQSAGMLYPSTWLSAYQVYAVVVFSFAGIGALGILRYGSPEERTLLTTIAVLGLMLAGVHALAYVEGRHRWGIEPLILLITARGMFSSVNWLRARRRPSVAAVTSG